MWIMCSLWLLLQMTMLSTHAKAAWQSLMALSTWHWNDGPAFLRPKGIRLYSNRPKRGGGGCLLHILWVDRDLVVALPQINLGKNGAPGHLGGEIQHVGQWVNI